MTTRARLIILVVAVIGLVVALISGGTSHDRPAATTTNALLVARV